MSFPAVRGAAGRAATAVRSEAAYVAVALAKAVRQSGRERVLVVQSLKSALAALIAWALATWWLPDPLSLMAPWVAVVLVQATVYQSVSQGVRQALAIVLGTALATGTALLVGHTMTALALVLPVTLLIGNWPRFGGQGIYVATSAIFAVAGGGLTLEVSAERVAAALIGAAVGITVNALLFPPAYLRSTRETLLFATREAGKILDAMADGVRDGLTAEGARRWFDRASRLPTLVEDVRSATRWSEESVRMNIQHRRSLQEPTPDSSYRDASYHSASYHSASYHDTVNTLWHLSDHIREMSRTLLEVADSRPDGVHPVAAHSDAFERFLRVVSAAVTAYGESAARTGQNAQQELEHALEQLDGAYDRLRQQLAERPVADSTEAEVLGPLLAEARRLSRQLGA
ncbi:aromatic acid exporter family protein [Streptomyces sp. 549]|uniref:FUSC family protein n=1 Tax=Streptomyces sp. 549 TaxID=3049076 RepID=UPI0024C34309|nr:aromatic acid exporter family protein [Streptomyces sp. 549]MDK1472852.1 aromatic acid exporter family protein [Streptomyces sp. 549]